MKHFCHNINLKNVLSILTYRAAAFAEKSKSAVKHVENCVLHRIGGNVFIYLFIIPMSSTDRGRVVGGLPDVVTIMENKVGLFVLQHCVGSLSCRMKTWDNRWKALEYSGEEFWCVVHDCVL